MSEEWKERGAKWILGEGWKEGVKNDVVKVVQWEGKWCS